jgi:alanine racemase
MNRLGFPPADARPERFDQFEVALLMTHLACAEEPQHPRNPMQLERFTEVTARFPGVATSMANSAGILLARSIAATSVARAWRYTARVRSTIR